jgi:hypothetical protein
MKKVMFTIALMTMVLLTACKPNQEVGPTVWPHASLSGQLWYAANPFEPENDTILCLKNVVYGGATDDAEYCSYLSRLFAPLDERFKGCEHYTNHPHPIIFIPSSAYKIYPKRDGQFMSVIDSYTGRISDSLSYFFEQSHPYVTIYTQVRNKEPFTDTQIYMGDEVEFYYDRRTVLFSITDTVTSTGEILICFDASKGISLTDWFELED